MTTLYTLDKLFTKYKLPNDMFARMARDSGFGTEYIHSNDSMYLVSKFFSFKDLLGRVKSIQSRIEYPCDNVIVNRFLYRTVHEYHPYLTNSDFLSVSRNKIYTYLLDQLFDEIFGNLFDDRDEIEEGQDYHIELPKRFLFPLISHSIDVDCIDFESFFAESGNNDIPYVLTIPADIVMKFVQCKE